MQELRSSPHLPIVAKGMPGQLPPHVSERQLFTLASAMAGADSRGKSNDKRRFLERDRRSLYRHWHLPGGTHPNTYETVDRNEVHIPITRGAHNTSFVDGATFAYLVEQIELRKAYMSMSEINTAISSDLGELLKTPKALDSNFVTDHLVEHSDGSLRLRYPMVTQGGTAPLFNIYWYGNEYLLPRDIAEILIYEEVAKRRQYATPSDLAQLTGLSRECLSTAALHGAYEASMCDGRCFILRNTVAHQIKKAESGKHDLPEHKRPALTVGRKLGLSVATFNESIDERDGFLFFTFPYLTNRGLATKEYRVYQAIGGIRYFSADDTLDMLTKDKETKKWLTADQLAAKTSVKKATLYSRPDVDAGIVEIGFGPNLCARLRYTHYRGHSLFHPDDSKVLIEVVGRVGTGVRRIATLGDVTSLLDFQHKTIHLTEAQQLSGGVLTRTESGNIGIKFEIFTASDGSQILAVNSADAKLIEFYLSLRAGAAIAQRTTMRLHRNLSRSSPSLKQPDKAMLGILGFFHRFPTIYSGRITAFFIQNHPEYADASVFDPKSPLGKLDERYLVLARSSGAAKPPHTLLYADTVWAYYHRTTRIR